MLKLCWKYAETQKTSFPRSERKKEKKMLQKSQNAKIWHEISQMERGTWSKEAASNFDYSRLSTWVDYQKTHRSRRSCACPVTTRMCSLFPDFGRKVDFFSPTWTIEHFNVSTQDKNLKNLAKKPWLILEIRSLCFPSLIFALSFFFFLQTS